MFILNIVFSLVLPVTYIIIGLIFTKRPPEKINDIAGWRTKSAMRDQETWKFANNYGGKCFIYLGIVELIFTLLIMIVMIFVFDTSQYIKDIVTLIVVILQFVLLIPCILKVEKAIRKELY